MDKLIHIILADDDPDDCFIFSSVSEEMREQLRTTCFGSCYSLLEFLENNPAPDIIFLDLNMPILSGQDCLIKLKANAKWKNIPVVIYSTAARKDIIDDCYLLGANHYIIKPNDSSTLRSAITSAIQQLIAR